MSAFKRRRLTLNHLSVWQVIVNYLEWPERLGTRTVCKDFHEYVPGLRLSVIRKLVLAELSQCCIRKTQAMVRHYFAPRLETFIPSEPLEVEPSRGRCFLFYHSRDTFVPLYANSLLTVRFVMQQISCTHGDPQQCDLAEVYMNYIMNPNYLESILRAARISGHIWMALPSVWSRVPHLVLKKLPGVDYHQYEALANGYGMIDAGHEANFCLRCATPDFDSEAFTQEKLRRHWEGSSSDAHDPWWWEIRTARDVCDYDPRIE